MVRRSSASSAKGEQRWGTELSALQQVRGRIQAREANATQGILTPLEAYLVNDIELINAAHAHLDVRPGPEAQQHSRGATRVDAPLRR